MERKAIEEIVLGIIREQLQRAPELSIPMEADFFNDLGGDSLDLAETSMEIEDQFNITLPDTAASTRIGDIVDTVVECVKEAHVPQT